VREDDTGAPSVVDVRALYGEIIQGLHRDGRRGRVLFCVSSDELAEGKGDLYVALGLARGLLADGWGVSLWTIDHAGEQTPSDIDIAVLMIESWVPGLIHPHSKLIAWVRNWTDEWAGLPYLDEFAEIWCSSGASAAAMAAVYSGEVRVVPLATDPELFAPVEVPRSAGVVTTVNYWGVPRGVQPALERVAADFPVVWYGVNSAFLTLADGIDHRNAIDYFSLPEVYSRWDIVVDDLIPAAARYGNQNSRLFDAVACGALVITNEASGLVELGLDEVPVYETPDDLLALVRRFAENPDEREALLQRLREVTLREHSWSARARMLRPALERVAGRAGADGRSAILVWATRLREQMRSDRREHDDYAAMYFAASRDAQEAHAELSSLKAAHNQRLYRIVAGAARPVILIRRRLRAKRD